MKNLIIFLLVVPLISFKQQSGEYESWVYFVAFLILPLWIFFAIYVNLPSKKEKKRKKNLGEFKTNIVFVTFIEKMKEIPDWYKIIQARGNAHSMMVDVGINVDNYDYWANAHKEEYMMKYNDGNLDVEGVKLRIEKFGYIASELEKVIKKAAELKLNATPEMHNEYHASRASVLAAEYALKEMSS